MSCFCCASLLTMSICGGIPTLAFAYINGKIKFSNHGKTPSEKQKRTVFRWLAFLLGSFMGCFLFPTYNFTKTYPNGSHWYSVYLWPTFAFTGESGYTLGSLRKIAHKGSHAETGVFRTGVVSLPSERSTRFGNPAWPGFKTANFAAFGAWSWVLPKNAESLRDSDALMRVAVPRRRGPAGLRDLFRFCRNCGLYALRSGPFRVCEAKGGITTLSALYVLLKRWTAACQKGSFAVF